jgi:hypothetical protein
MTADFGPDLRLTEDKLARRPFLLCVLCSFAPLREMIS